MEFVETAVSFLVDSLSSIGEKSPVALVLIGIVITSFTLFIWIRIIYNIVSHFKRKKSINDNDDSSDN